MSHSSPLRSNNQSTQQNRPRDAVRRWFIINGLQLNPAKTEVMFLGTSQNLSYSSISDCKTFNMSGTAINVTDQIKSLGVFIDSRLSFDKQVSCICRASYSNIKALRKIRSTLDLETAKTVACAIVSARLDYCNSILYGTSIANINKLQRVQNSLARVVSGCRRYDHITPVRKSLHWLPISERIIYKIASITFKSKQTGQPAYLSSLIHPYVPARQLRSSGENKLVVPFTRIEAASKSFSVAAPTVFNNLPEAVRNCDTASNFAIKLKTFLFDRAYKI